MLHLITHYSVFVDCLDTGIKCCCYLVCGVYTQGLFADGAVQPSLPPLLALRLHHLQQRTTLARSRSTSIYSESESEGNMFEKVANVSNHYWHDANVYYLDYCKIKIVQICHITINMSNHISMFVAKHKFAPKLNKNLYLFIFVTLTI